MKANSKVIFSLLITMTVTVVGLMSNSAITAASTGRLSKHNTTSHSKQAGAAQNNDVFHSDVFSLGAYDDTTLGFIADVKAASYLGASQRNALALEVAGGPNEIRVNTTYGVTLTDNQRVKFTYEFLGQDLDFDFDSGTVSEWVFQNALGGDYAYLINNPYIEAVGVGGYYTHSGSKELSDKAIDESRLDKRRIAGANSGNVHADVVLRLWPHSRLTSGVDYDIVRYDSKYTASSNDADGFGGHIKLEQRLLPQLKASASAQLQQIQRQYAGSLGWLMPSPAGMQFELVAISKYVDSMVTNRHFFTNGLRFNASLNPGSRRYDDLDQGKQQSLLTWTRTPSVRMATVLAVADRHSGPGQVACLQPGEIEQVGGDEDNPIYGGHSWTQEAIEGLFSIEDEVVFVSANYEPNTGTAECVYEDTDTDDTLTLTRNATGVMGEDWEANICRAASGGTIETCLFTI